MSSVSVIEVNVRSERRSRKGMRCFIVRYIYSIDIKNNSGLSIIIKTVLFVLNIMMIYG